MLPKTGLFLAGFLAALPLAAFPARADISPVTPIQLLSSQVTTNSQSQTITFALTFDRAPDLQNYNSYSNAADEFAIDLLNHPLDHAVLTGAGGEDLRILSSQYRVTDSTANYGRVPTPLDYAAITTPRYAGSLLLELVPFNEVGSTVTITAPFASLHETDGWFEATLETYRFGAWGGRTIEIGTAFPDPEFAPQFGFVAVPEPASLALLGLGGMALLVRRKQRPRPFNRAC